MEVVEMKYGIYKLEVGNLFHHFYAKLDSKDVQGMEPVAKATTRKEASETAIKLGQAL